MKRLTITMASAAALLALIACSPEEPETTAEPRPTATVITHTSPPSSPASSPTPTESNTPDSVSPGDDLEITCRDGRSQNPVELSSFEEAWNLDLDERVRCSVAFGAASATGHELSDLEMEALEVAEYSEGSLDLLYGQCARSHLGDHDERIPYTEGQVAETHGALVLCPDHPERDEVESRIAAVEERHADLDDMRAGIEDGSLIEGGLHRVGEGIEPGVYVAESDEGFEGCYWERLDSAGNIIANNFVREGFRAEVEVQATDYSFSSSSCGMWERE